MEVCSVWRVDEPSLNSAATREEDVLSRSR